MATIVITGGTGLIGTALSRLLVSRNHSVIILTRTPKASDVNISYSQWDIKKAFIDPEVIKSADHIIHLAGAGVADKRWTKKRKEEIRNSRVHSGNLLVEALRTIPNKVQTVVSASGEGWYGPDKKGSRPFTESDPPYTDFLGETCRLWESSIQPVTQLGKKLVILRTGIVLSNQGGAFPEFKKAMKAGVAAILGSGRQMISWIHIDDICRLYAEALTNPYMNGVYNAVAPEHVTNKQFMLKTARARKRPFIAVHVPEFVLKLMLGEMSIEVLKSATVDATKIRSTGFNYIYPTLDAALNQLI